MPKLINRRLLYSLLSVAIPVILQLSYIKYVSSEVPANLFGEYVLLSAFSLGISQVAISIPLQAFNRYYNRSNNKVQIVNEFRSYGVLYFLVLVAVYFIVFIQSTSQFELLVLVLLFFHSLLFFNFSLNSQLSVLNMEQQEYFYIKIFEAATKFGFPLLGYYITGELNGLLFGLVLGYVLTFTFVWKKSVSKIKYNFTFDYERTKKYFMYAYPILFSAVASWVISYSDRLFIDFFVSTEALGTYAILVQFSSFAQVIGTVFAIYVTPQVLSLYECEPAHATRLLNKYLFLLALLMLALLLLVIAIPREVIEFFIGVGVLHKDNNFMIFIIVTVSIFVTVFQTSLSLYFVLYERLGVHSKLFIIAAALNLLLNFFVMEYGVIAAAVSTLVSYIILLLLILVWLRLNNPEKNYA